jgi:hypothetical protein
LTMNRESLRQIIVEDLGMREISTKMVPWILTDDQTQLRLHTRTEGESAVLFGSADKVTGICLEEKTWTLAWQVDSPPCNTHVHDALTVHVFLGKKSIIKMDHRPYAPDLDPAIFGSFQN